MAKPTLPGAWSLLVLGLLGAAVFGPAIAGAELLNFDDNLFFDREQGAFPRLYEQSDLGAILDPRRTLANAYLPVSHLSLYADYVVGRALGLGAGWARTHSLLLHVLAAFALARLIGRLGVPAFPATAAAAVFLVHPALVESVAWVSSRKDVLSGLFAFLCLGAVARHAERPRWTTLAAAAGFAALAMLAKGTAVVLAGLAPLVVALAGGAGGRRWLAVPAVAAVALAGGVFHAAVAAEQGTLVAGAVAERLGRVPGAFLHYLETLAWPLGLNVLYPEVATLERFAGALGPGLLALGAVLAAAVGLRRRRPRLAAGLAMACVALLPFNTAWPASSIAAADRYLYLVVPFAALALVGVARSPRWGGVAAAAAALPLAVLAADRARDFASSTALWESSLAADPDNAVARLNLAKVVAGRDAARARELAEGAAAAARLPAHRYWAEAFLRDLALREGHLEEATRRAERACAALAEAPPSAGLPDARLTALLQLATLRLFRGEAAGARAAVAEAAALAPAHPAVLASQALLLLSDAAGADGRLDAASPAWPRARALLEQALAAEPDHRDAHLALARWQLARGEWLGALKHLRRARGADPAPADTYLLEADLFLSTGDFAAAEDVARRGLAAGARDPALLVRLGQALAGQGRLAAAREHYERYLAERPLDPAARRLVAAALAAETAVSLFQKPPDELEHAARRILELDRDNAKAWLIRGAAARLRRDLAAALVCFERAHDGLPEDVDVQRLLAETHRDRGYELLRQRDPPDAAYDHLRTFVGLRVPGLDPRAALDVLRGEWRRLEQRGTDAFRAGDFAAAERAFARCLALAPEETSACLQLGLALLALGRDRYEEALAQFERAERGQRDRGLDASMPVLYQVLTLQRLGRTDEAEQRGRRFLEDPTPARPDVLERLRVAVGG